jgi:hypothetical protein
LIVALWIAGCATTAGGRGERVDEVHLFGLPVAFNVDANPGADGFAVRVFVTKAGGAKGSPINSGVLEVIMFDGVLGAVDVASSQPAQTWRFTPRQLVSLREQTSLGTGYRFALRWQQQPTRGYITVVARYVPPQGEPVSSAPSAITVSSK